MDIKELLKSLKQEDFYSKVNLHIHSNFSDGKLSPNELLEDANKKGYKLIAICIFRGIRIIVENPFSALHYLHNNFLSEPTIIDNDRTRRGDYFKKPTGYWFFNCTNTFGCSFEKPKKQMTVWESKSSGKVGICSEARSMISPDYARNFICDFILGKEQIGTQLNIFD